MDKIPRNTWGHKDDDDDDGDDEDDGDDDDGDGEDFWITPARAIRARQVISTSSAPTKTFSKLYKKIKTVNMMMLMTRTVMMIIKKMLTMAMISSPLSLSSPY